MKYLAFVVLAVTGCSTTNYSEPLEGDRARVRFVAATDSITAVYGYRDEECTDGKELMRLKEGFIVRSAPKPLGMPLPRFSKNAAKEFYFESGVEHHFMFLNNIIVADKIYSCGVPVRVRFETNRDYELHYASLFTQCSVKVSKIIETEGQPERRAIGQFDSAITDGCRKAFWESR